MAFTTKDHDNDLEKNVNCAQKYQGAWWYKSCHQVKQYQYHTLYIFKLVKQLKLTTDEKKYIFKA